MSIEECDIIISIITSSKLIIVTRMIVYYVVWYNYNSIINVLCITTYYETGVTFSRFTIPLATLGTTDRLIVLFLELL